MFNAYFMVIYLFFFFCFYIYTKNTSQNTKKCGLTRRSASLRQTRTSQEVTETQIMTEENVQTPLTTTPNTASSTPKKGNWEVIEHFKTDIKGRGSVSSSLIAV